MVVGVPETRTCYSKIDGTIYSGIEAANNEGEQLGYKRLLQLIKWAVESLEFCRPARRKTPEMSSFLKGQSRVAFVFKMYDLLKLKNFSITYITYYSTFFGATVL